MLCPKNKGILNYSRKVEQTKPNISKINVKENFIPGIQNRKSYCFLIVIVQLYTFCPEVTSIVTPLLKETVRTITDTEILEDLELYDIEKAKLIAGHLLVLINGDLEKYSIWISMQSNQSLSCSSKI